MNSLSKLQKLFTSYLELQLTSLNALLLAGSPLRNRYRCTLSISFFVDIWKYRKSRHELKNRIERFSVKYIRQQRWDSPYGRRYALVRLVRETYCLLLLIVSNQIQRM